MLYLLVVRWQERQWKRDRELGQWVRLVCGMLSWSQFESQGSLLSIESRVNPEHHQVWNTKRKKMEVSEKERRGKGERGGQKPPWCLLPSQLSFFPSLFPKDLLPLPRLLVGRKLKNHPTCSLTLTKCQTCSDRLDATHKPRSLVFRYLVTGTQGSSLWASLPALQWIFAAIAGSSALIEKRVLGLEK